MALRLRPGSRGARTSLGHISQKQFALGEAESVVVIGKLGVLADDVAGHVGPLVDGHEEAILCAGGRVVADHEAVGVDPEDGVPELAGQGAHAERFAARVAYSVTEHNGCGISPNSCYQ